jgi:hypothetical protein
MVDPSQAFLAGIGESTGGPGGTSTTFTLAFQRAAIASNGG